MTENLTNNNNDKCKWLKIVQPINRIVKNKYIYCNLSNHPVKLGEAGYKWNRSWLYSVMKNTWIICWGVEDGVYVWVSYIRRCWDAGNGVCRMSSHRHIQSHSSNRVFLHKHYLFVPSWARKINCIVKSQICWLGIINLLYIQGEKKTKKTHFSEDYLKEYICIWMTAALLLEKIINVLQQYFIFGSPPGGHVYTSSQAFNLWGKQMVYILLCEITSDTLWTLKNMMCLS